VASGAEQFYTITCRHLQCGCRWHFRVNEGLALMGSHTLIALQSCMSDGVDAGAHTLDQSTCSGGSGKRLFKCARLAAAYCEY
jgi:hypothetical protein